MCLFEVCNDFGSRSDLADSPRQIQRKYAFLQAKAAKMHLTSPVAAAGLESAGKFRTSEMEKTGSCYWSVVDLPWL